MYQKIKLLGASFATLTLAFTPLSAMQAQEAQVAETAPVPAGENKKSKVESEVVGVFFMRQSVVPRAGDEVPLKQGQMVMIGSSSGGMPIVKYKVQDGQIVYEVTSGSIDKKTKKAIEKAIRKLQKKI